MPLDPQIPLAAAQQPSFAQQAGQVYQLAGAIEKQRDEQAMRQDQQILQEGLKQEGINMTTSEGLMKLADWAKERGVSVKSQGMVGQAISDSRKQELEMRHLLTQQSLDNNKIGAAKKGEIVDQLSPVWDQWKQDRDNIGEEAANINLQKNLQPAIEKMATRTDAGGSSYYDPNVVKQLSGINNGKGLESELNRIDSFRKMQQEILGNQSTQQKISESKKREAFIGKEKPVGGSSGQPGGVGSMTFQDTTTGQKYNINNRTGQAWKVDEEGNWESVNPNSLPKNLAKVGSIGQMGSREATILQREIQATSQAARDLENVSKLPISVSTGMFGGRKQGEGLLSATKEVLANKMTSEEVQIYNTMSTGFQRSLSGIEAAGMMPTGTLSHQMDAVLLKEGDTNLTKISKLAQIRQIVETGLEAMEANPRVSESEKALAAKIRDRVEKAVPFTQSDVIQLMSSGGNVSLSSLMRSEKKKISADETNTGKSTEVPRGATSAKDGAAWSASDEARLKELEAKHGAQ